MKRNDRAIKKTINYQLKLSGEMSNAIFIIFKRLYFDIKMNQKDQSTFNSLGKVVCQKNSGQKSRTSVPKFLEKCQVSNTGYPKRRSRKSNK